MKKASSTKPVRQGDVRFVPVRRTDVPANAKLAPDLTVGHSETGHHHVAEAPAGSRTVRLITEDPLVCYLVSEVEEEVRIVHQRSWDTHQTIVLPCGPDIAWRVVQAREYVPGGWRRAAD